MHEPGVLSFITGTHRPRWRGRIHTWAFTASIPGLIMLVAVSQSRTARIGAAIFGLSLIALYGASAAYHRLAKTHRAQRLMRRLDHSMIFVLIAGTYTPVCLVSLPGQWRWSILAAIWALAALGIGAKVLGTDTLIRASNGLYIAMGWLALIALPTMLEAISPAVLTLMVLGGAIYTVGAVLFYLRRPDPVPEVFGYHEVWHTFTVCGSLAHFAMVALVVS